MIRISYNALQEEKIIMATKEKEYKIDSWCKDYPGNRPPRFLQPFLLVFLKKGSAHGYQLINNLAKLGVKHENYEVGYIYKTLRTMEKDGYIASAWNTEAKGAAKRIYTITENGTAQLQKWMISIKQIRKSLKSLLDMCEDTCKET